MAAAHSRVITHRDIKPDNLFVTRDDRINCCRAREVHAARIFRQGLDGSSAQPMSQEGQTLTLTGVSTKGKLLPVIEVATGRTLLLSVAGGDGEVPKGILAEERIANWTADCSGLFVYQAGFFRADLKTGKRQLQVEIAPSDQAGVALGAVGITPDGKSYAFTADQGLAVLHVIDGLK